MGGAFGQSIGGMFGSNNQPYQWDMVQLPQQGQQTPQQQVDQSQQSGGILKIRGQQPGNGVQMRSPFEQSYPSNNAQMGLPVERQQSIPFPGMGGGYMTGRQHEGIFMGKPVEYAGQQPPNIGMPMPMPMPNPDVMPDPGQQQYFQQMHQNMDGMNENMDGLSEALQQIEGMQMPGGQYRGGGYTPGGGGGKFGSIGLGKQYDFNHPQPFENKTF